MYHDTGTIVRERRYDAAPLLTPNQSIAAEHPTLNMGRAVENFHRMSADKTEMRENSRVRRSAKSIIRALFGSAAMLGIAVAAMPNDAVARSPVACGTTYTVERGDTLFRIAKRAYGNGKLYKKIYQTNREVLPNSASVEIGDEIQIPCLDGTGEIVQQDPVTPESIPEPDRREIALFTQVTEPVQPVSGNLTLAEAPVALAAPPIAPIARLFDRNSDPANDMLDAIAEVEPEESRDMAPPIRLLAGSVGAPFAGAHLPHGGMITDLVSRAVDLASPGQQSHVTFANDRTVHLDNSLSDDTFDVSFPWTKPTCEKSEQLSSQMQKRCAEFEFSDPILEVRLGFYTRPGNALAGASTFATLTGKRLCRPTGQFTVDLEQYGLVEPKVSVETQINAAHCFALLIAGRVDVVALVKSEASVNLAERGFAGTVAEIDGLEAWQTLHALVPKQNPNARAVLDTINRGLAELMASGIWFQVVSTHQSQQLALKD
jgi:polar amino acid transport system substrate-binding protein